MILNVWLDFFKVQYFILKIGFHLYFVVASILIPVMELIIDIELYQ